MTFQSRRPFLVSFLIASLVACLTFHHIRGLRWIVVSDDLASKAAAGQEPISLPPSRNQPECARFAPAQEILVVIKTGATEIHQKLPVHFQTTLRCIPHFVIYSDMPEEINGYQVHDVLASLSPTIKTTHKDFALYRKLQQYRIEDRNVSTLTETNDKSAWDLDKWKFLPMMSDALRARPTAKWFFFIETDTAVVWNNLFTYISKFGADKPWYLGGSTWIGDVEFAHGGTGWVMSRPAVRLVAEKWMDDQVELEELVAGEWAGDKVLAMVLKDVDVGITPSWPIFQGETPYSLDYSAKHWCYPVATYHHVDSEAIRAIAAFQEEWVSAGNEQKPPRHRDAFEHFVQPHLRPQRQQWDNTCDNEQPVAPSNAHDCRKACQADPPCLQWFYTPGKCRTGNVVRLGSSMEHGEDEGEAVSGWIMERVADFKKQQAACGNGDYWSA